MHVSLQWENTQFRFCKRQKSRELDTLKTRGLSKCTYPLWDGALTLSGPYVLLRKETIVKQNTTREPSPTNPHQKTGVEKTV